MGSHITTRFFKRVINNYVRQSFCHCYLTIHMKLLNITSTRNNRTVIGSRIGRWLFVAVALRSILTDLAWAVLTSLSMSMLCEIQLLLLVRFNRKYRGFDGRSEAFRARCFTQYGNFGILNTDTLCKLNNVTVSRKKNDNLTIPCSFCRYDLYRSSDSALNNHRALCSAELFFYMCH